MSSEDVVSKLLQKNVITGPKIEVIGEPSESVNDVKDSADQEVNVVESGEGASEKEGPTMLEMMIAAQQEAAREAAAKKAELEKEQQQRMVKKGFAGFKKGFFSDTTKKTPSPTTSSSSSTQGKQHRSEPSPNGATPASTTKKEDVVEIKKPSNPKIAGSGRENSSKAVILEEVQHAMEEDQHPLLKQLQSQEWVTPDLTSKLMTNPVLKRGFGHPKCMAAMQLMQKDPQEAKKRFEGDPEVTAFLREFGKLMADHFEGLGSQKSRSSPASSVSPSSTVTIEEVQPKAKPTGTPGGGATGELGPLQARALEKASASGGENMTKKTVKNPEDADIEEIDTDELRVKKILEDPELRDMLMDPDLQRILMECGDPRLFQQHMHNPTTARKLQRLKAAGLVQLQV
eukprot:scaffold978_cov172-Ochromonas_danica.AAC.12